MKEAKWREASWETGALEMNPAAIGAFAKQAGGKLGSMASTSHGTASVVLGTAGEGLRDAGMGAGIGASIGSVIPGIGTVIGGAIGAIGGAIVGVVHYLFGGGLGGHAARLLTAKERNLLDRGAYINRTRHLPGAFQDAVLYVYNPAAYRRLRAQRRLPSEIEAVLLKKRAYATHAAAIDRQYGARIRRELAHLPPELRTLIGVSTVTGHARELYIALHRALAERERLAHQAARRVRELHLAIPRALVERARLEHQVALASVASPPEEPDAPALPEPPATPEPASAQESPYDPFRDLPLPEDVKDDADRASADAGGVLDDLAISLEQSRRSQRRYLRGSWVNDTWLGDFLHLDQPDDPSAPVAPAPSPGSGRPPPITLVPEPDTGDIVDDVYGKGLDLARVRPFLRARRLQAIAPGDPPLTPEARVFDWSDEGDTREAFDEAFGRRFGSRVFRLLRARGWRFVEVVPESQDAGAVPRTYTAQGDETPQAIARRYDAFSRERWAGELKAANPQRDWTARVYAGDLIAIPEAWPQPFWGAAKERGFLDASGPTGELAVETADPFVELGAQRARQRTFGAGSSS